MGDEVIGVTVIQRTQDVILCKSGKCLKMDMNTILRCIKQCADNKCAKKFKMYVKINNSYKKLINNGTTTLQIRNKKKKTIYQKLPILRIMMHIE